MKILVTGAAGFIGHHLCMTLAQAGEEVHGIDCFTDYYDRALKQKNFETIQPMLTSFTNVALGQSTIPFSLAEFDAVVHLAGQPGVRKSWGKDFQPYIDHNIRATQSLLETIANQAPNTRLVYASSSSIYGDAETSPTSELATPRPISPYGVSKLAAEHLVSLYQTQMSLSTVSLRFFSVFGPRQRPDMAFRRLVDRALDGGEFELNGDGLQTRDFTYVHDVVDGIIRSVRSDWCGVLNLGSDNPVSMQEAILVLEELTGQRINIRREAKVRGDARDTRADITLARKILGFEPQTSLRDGLAAMLTQAELDGVALL
jgi:nucleoside-diphosphate-sugar epimerase